MTHVLLRSQKSSTLVLSQLLDWCLQTSVPGFDFGNFSNDWVFGEFPENLGIRDIFQIPRNLGNFLDTQAFGKYPRYPGIWEIPIFDIFDNCCHSLRFLFRKQWKNSQKKNNFNKTTVSSTFWIRLSF